MDRPLAVNLLRDLDAAGDVLDGAVAGTYGRLIHAGRLRAELAATPLPAGDPSVLAARAHLDELENAQQGEQAVLEGREGVADPVAAGTAAAGDDAPEAAGPPPSPLPAPSSGQPGGAEAARFDFGDRGDSSLSESAIYKYSA